MANKRITDKLELTSVASDDLIPVIDVSDTTDSAEGTLKKVKKSAFGIGDYSTSEIDTGYKWIDGKDIYKKTVNFGTLANNTTKNVNHGITNIDRIIDAHDNFVNVSSGELLPISYNSATGSTARVGFNVDKTAIKTYANFDATTYSGYVTIYYTKT